MTAVAGTAYRTAKPRHRRTNVLVHGSELVDLQAVAAALAIDVDDAVKHNDARRLRDDSLPILVVLAGDVFGLRADPDRIARPAPGYRASYLRAWAVVDAADPSSLERVRTELADYPDAGTTTRAMRTALRLMTSRAAQVGATLLGPDGRTVAHGTEQAVTATMSPAYTIRTLVDSLGPPDGEAEELIQRLSDSRLLCRLLGYDRSVHAEVVALGAFAGPVRGCVVTRPPCATCLKQLIHRGATGITFLEPFPNPDLRALALAAARAVSLEHFTGVLHVPDDWLPTSVGH